VWVFGCGVVAAAGQFGHITQGVFAFWINAHLRRASLRYIGFGGHGHQVRDCLHPNDLGALILRQMEAGDGGSRPRLVNVSGGIDNSMSLLQLTQWCDARFGRHEVGEDPRPRPFDIPWLVLNPAAANAAWDWSPRVDVKSILEEIAVHAEQHHDWLRLSGGA
jgi:CDP-paratose 2-epimerase